MNTIAFNTFLNRELKEIEIKKDSCKILISGSYDYRIILWDTLTSTSIHILDGHNDIINDLELISDKFLASCSDDKTIKIWNLSDIGNKKQRNLLINTLEGHESGVICVKYFNNDVLLSGGSDNLVIMWDLIEYKMRYKLSGHLDWVYCLEILSNNLFASGSFDKTIRIWNINHKEDCKILNGHLSEVKYLIRISENALISGSNDGLIKIWDYNFGIEKTPGLFKYEDSNEGMTFGSIESIRILSKRRVAIGYSDGTILVYDSNDQTVKAILNSNGEAKCLKELPDNRLASGHDNGLIIIWDLNNNEMVFTLDGHGRDMTAHHGRDINDLKLISFDRLASASNDCTIKVWDIKRGGLAEMTMLGHMAEVTCLKLINFRNKEII
jgi:WD40 repeat protein